MTLSLLLLPRTKRHNNKLTGSPGAAGVIPQRGREYGRQGRKQIQNVCCVALHTGTGRSLL